LFRGAERVTTKDTKGTKGEQRSLAKALRR
jgi:hypothetical protein